MKLVQCQGKGLEGKTKLNTDAETLNSKIKEDREPQTHPTHKLRLKLTHTHKIDIFILPYTVNML